MNIPSELVTSEQLREYGEFAEVAARAGGDVLRDWRGRFAVSAKGPRDLVTEADLASQKTIREILLSKFPNHGFIGEEGDQDSSVPSLRWKIGRASCRERV